MCLSLSVNILAFFCNNKVVLNQYTFFHYLRWLTSFYHLEFGRHFFFSINIIWEKT